MKFMFKKLLLSSNNEHIRWGCFKYVYAYIVYRHTIILKIFLYVIISCSLSFIIICFLKQVHISFSFDSGIFKEFNLSISVFSICPSFFSIESESSMSFFTKITFYNSMHLLNAFTCIYLGESIIILSSSIFFALCAISGFFLSSIRSWYCCCSNILCTALWKFIMSWFVAFPLISNRIFQFQAFFGIII